MTLEQFYWNTLYGGIILFHVLFGQTEKQILVYLYLSESINRTFFRRHFIRKICLAKDGHRFLNQLNFWEQTNFFSGKIRYRSEKTNWTFVQWEKERKKRKNGQFEKELNQLMKCVAHKRWTSGLKRRQNTPNYISSSMHSEHQN